MIELDWMDVWVELVGLMTELWIVLFCTGIVYPAIYDTLLLSSFPPLSWLVDKPILMKFSGVPPKKKLMEFDVTKDCLLPVGTPLYAQHYIPGMHVNVTGISKGKGFQGVMKRWGFGGQPATHGVSLTHRSLGSTGNRQTPGRVFKGKKMPGHMGARQRTAINMMVFKIDPYLNLVFIKGAIPGPKNGWVKITDTPYQTCIHLFSPPSHIYKPLTKVRHRRDTPLPHIRAQERGGRATGDPLHTRQPTLTAAVQRGQDRPQPHGPRALGPARPHQGPDRHPHQASDHGRPCQGSVSFLFFFILFLSFLHCLSLSLVPLTAYSMEKRKKEKEAIATRQQLEKQKMKKIVKAAKKKVDIDDD